MQSDASITDQSKNFITPTSGTSSSRTTLPRWRRSWEGDKKPRQRHHRQQQQLNLEIFNLSLFIQNFIEVSLWTQVSYSFSQEAIYLFTLADYANATLRYSWFAEKGRRPIILYWRESRRQWHCSVYGRWPEPYLDFHLSQSLIRALPPLLLDLNMWKTPPLCTLLVSGTVSWKWAW